MTIRKTPSTLYRIDLTVWLIFLFFVNPFLLNLIYVFSSFLYNLFIFYESFHMMSHFGALNSSFESLIEEWLILISEIWFGYKNESSGYFLYLDILFISDSDMGLLSSRIWYILIEEGGHTKTESDRASFEGKITLPELSCSGSTARIRFRVSLHFFRRSHFSVYT